MTNKNAYAKTPPMGWNSWDCYGASVNEKELLANADYMAKNMKEFGWEYIVCDIQWYEPNASAHDYHDFVPLDMDEYGRLIPAVKRFPSAANGNGFKFIADYVHNLGLKFGIHIMRGVPRQAAHSNTPILGSNATARQIAQRFSVCSWNTDMYGINAAAIGAQAYYNSIFQMYAQWGVDFVKVDDICNTYFNPSNLYSAKQEIELIRNAIDNCGREMVLSLSPGPADVTVAEHLSENANMWRITSDLWDTWGGISAMFNRCKNWSSYVKEGCWPDCDMLPLGHINIRGDEHGLHGARYSRLTNAEQITMMTLWCIFRSALMMGGELNDNDSWTLSLLTNREVLRLTNHSYGAQEVFNCASRVIWKSYDEDGSVYFAVFNLSSNPVDVEMNFASFGLEGAYTIRNLWNHEELMGEYTSYIGNVDTHGAILLKLTKV